MDPQPNALTTPVPREQSEIEAMRPLLGRYASKLTKIAEYIKVVKLEPNLTPQERAICDLIEEYIREE